MPNVACIAGRRSQHVAKHPSLRQHRRTLRQCMCSVAHMMGHLQCTEPNATACPASLLTLSAFKGSTWASAMMVRCTPASALPPLPPTSTNGAAAVCFQVLDEYRRRDGLMQQLLSERDEVRRSARRTNAESSKLERERDDAVNTAAKLKV